MVRILVVMAAVIGLALPASADDDSSRVEFSQPGVICLPLNAQAHAKIASGDLRLVLGITKYAPLGDEATIVASLVHSADGSATELARAHMYPSGNFTASIEDTGRRFEVSLRAAGTLLADLYASCIRIELVDFQGQSNGGVLEGFLELVSRDG